MKNYLLFLLIGSLFLTGQIGYAQKPNIVFILADDLGYTDLGCYGNPFHETPYLDALASKGVKFQQAYSACPVCSPSRAAIMTGKYPARLHLTNYIAGDRRDSASPVDPPQWKKYLSPKEVTLAEILKGAGYKTGIAGKWHLGHQNEDSTAAYQQGFDYDRIIDKNGLDYYNYTITSKGKTVFADSGRNYITDQLTDYAIDFIETNKQQPFFLYLPYSAPHVFIVPKAEKLGKYYLKYSKFEKKYNPSYAALLESLDEGIGKVVKKLEQEGLLENTIIIFTSDNGGLGLDELGPAPTSLEPLRTWKGHVYEGGIRVPLIVSWKGKITPKVTDSQVIGTDFLPTIAELAGIRYNTSAIDGKSFATALQNKSTTERGPVFWHYPHFSNQLGRPSGAVRSGDFKLVENYENGQLELYNLRNDLSEKKNLSQSDPSKTKELHDLLIKWRKEVKASMPVRKNNK